MRFQNPNSKYLYEGLDLSASNTMVLWESAGFKLKESALTADQIQQIFTAVEQGATAAGSNRTMLGKGKDAAEAVNTAWEDLKSKVQNSAPIKAVDQKYDSVVAKIETGLGGPNNAVNQVIQKYRKFAKEHPIAQGFIYSALIAAAGISGAGLGGAAVLGLLKMADKLLQGEKFSSAAYSGAKTGAMAYGASKLGDIIKGKPEGGSVSTANVPVADIQAIRQQAGNEAMKAVKDALANGADPSLRGELESIAQAAAEKFSTLQGGRLSVQSAEAIAQKAAAQAIRAAGKAESIVWQSKPLSEGQIYLVFNRICQTNDLFIDEGRVVEGPLDALKGLAAKGLQKAQTVGKNLTTKVTADKLNSAWQKAGSPMDSGQLAAFLGSQGVSPDVVSDVYKSMKIEIPAGGTASAEQPGEQPAAEPAKTPSQYADVKAMIAKLDKKSRQRIAAYLQKQLGTA